MCHTAYLGHLQADDLGVCALATGDVACVAADDLGPLGITAVVLDALVTEGGLVLREGDTGNLAAVVLVRERGEGTPAAAYIKETVLRLEVELRGAPLVEVTDTGKNKCPEPSHRRE